MSTTISPLTPAQTCPGAPSRVDRLPDTRNEYGALLHVPEWCRALMREAEAAGTYTTGIESVQRLAVIQVRECHFRAGRLNRVRKDYYMLGHAEDGSVFAHPVESPARSKRAMASPEMCVLWVLAQIWACKIEDLDEIRRQGDIAFVPDRLPADAKPLAVQTVTIRDTHVLTAHQIWQAGSTYYVSRKARVVHTKN